MLTLHTLVLPQGLLNEISTDTHIPVGVWSCLAVHYCGLFAIKKFFFPQSCLNV